MAIFDVNSYCFSKNVIAQMHLDIVQNTTEYVKLCRKTGKPYSAERMRKWVHQHRCLMRIAIIEVAERLGEGEGDLQFRRLRL